MKKILILPLLSVVLLATGLVVYAHAPSVSIDYVQGQEVGPGRRLHLVLPYLPYTVDIEGVVDHGPRGNVNAVELSATSNGELFYGPEKVFTGYGNIESASYTLPWTIPYPGRFLIQVIASHGNESSATTLGQNPGPTSSNNKGCKAAPALATEYLRDNDESNKDVISEVAHETGKDGSLWAKDSCRVDYEVETIELVIDLTS